MIFRGNSQHKSSAHCTSHLLIMVHVYKHWGGGNCLSEYWPLQQRHPYLKGVLIYGGVQTCGEIQYGSQN